MGFGGRGRIGFSKDGIELLVKQFSGFIPKVLLHFDDGLELADGFVKSFPLGHRRENLAHVPQGLIVLSVETIEFLYVRSLVQSVQIGE